MLSGRRKFINLTMTEADHKKSKTEEAEKIFRIRIAEEYIYIYEKVGILAVVKFEHDLGRMVICQLNFEGE